MHLLVPFAAALSDAAVHALRGLPLSNLARLLSGLSPGARDDGDEYSLSPPHERALAAAWGWAGSVDGCLPFAAQGVIADGIDPGGRAWGLLTPVHWHVGREQITLADPAALQLNATESGTLLDAVRPLFESEGWAIAYGAADRWYAAHDSLADLPCASLDRVIGRNVDLWLTPGPQTRLLRRLQNEVQMLLYGHPLNDEREARGALAVNSFWVSGCGRARLVDPGAAEIVRVDSRLREPVLAGDWAGWADAWRALDATALAEALHAAGRGEPLALTLCGERGAQRFDSSGAARSGWQSRWQRWSDKLNPRFKAVEPAALLESL